jgi:cell wall-associated NlpC family hydrolase
MSFSDAIGQIDQIVQWEQQLTNPAAATQTTSTTSTGGTSATGDATSTSTTGSSSPASASFADALAQAQEQEGEDAISTLDPTSSTDSSLLGSTDATDSTDTSDLLGGGDSQLLTALSSMSGSDDSDSSSLISALESALQSGQTSNGTTDATATADATGSTDAATTAATAALTTDSGPSGGEATSAGDPRIQAMTEEANALVGKPYVYGGGHDGWGPQSGYDCSGFVSAVLHAGGYLSTPQDTTTLPSAAGIESGPGQYVTIYDRDEPGQTGHVIIDVAGQFYESGGEHGSWGGGGGVEEISTPSASYLATFDRVLHPAGL